MRQSQKAKSKGPKAPAWLGPGPAKVWAEYAPGMIEAGLLLPSDYFTFGRFCSTAYMWEQAEARLDDGDMVMAVGSRGYFQLDPWFTVWMKLSDALDKLESKLGMDPLARTRLRIEAPPAPEKKSKLELWKAGI